MIYHEYTYQEGERGRVLISCESCVREEENSLSWCILNSKEVLLRRVGEASIANIDEAIELNEYKRSNNQIREDEWKQKIMHGQFLDNFVNTTETGISKIPCRMVNIALPGNNLPRQKIFTV